MTQALTTGAIAICVSLLATPLARRFLSAIGMTDAPGRRRIHAKAIPRGGGIAVVLAAVVACVSTVGVPTGLSPLVLAGASVLLLVGLVDDRSSLRPHVKLLGQVTAASLAVAGGVRLTLLAPAGGGALGLLDAYLTGFWIVFVTNAVNLSDGLDGLAAGIGVLACSWLAAASFAIGDPGAAIAPVALAGALLGFLAYNFNPASIFLGDAGSLVIGYALAVMPLAGPQGTGVPPLAAALFVAFPVTDTMLAIARRFVVRSVRIWNDGQFVRGLIEGLKNTMSPDRGHIHHRLLDLGFSQRRAVAILYAAAVTTGALGYVVTSSTGWPLDLFAVGLAVGVIVVVQALGFKELQPVRSGLFLPLFRRLATHRWLMIPVDVCITAACYAAVLFLAGGRAVSAHMVATIAALVVMASAQVAMFTGLGVYRTAWRSSGVMGFGLLIRACACATVAGYVALRVLALPVGAPIAFVYFFLSLSAVTWTRFSYALLAQASVRAAAAEPTLICGTTSIARNALAHLRTAGFGHLRPVGFVEFRARLQGRRLDQLPVLGTLEALHGLIRKHGITDLVIADPALRGEALAWVRAICRQQKVRVHRYIEKFLSRDESIEELRAAPDIATAWAVLSRLFDTVGIDGCMLLVGPDTADFGRDGRGRIYAWRRIPEADAGMSCPLTACLRDGWNSIAGIESRANGNGQAHEKVAENGHARTNREAATVLRRDGDHWRRMVAAVPQAQDVLALPVHSRGELWGVLLATSQAGDRVVSAGDVARIKRAAAALGKQVAQWDTATSGNGNGNGNGQEFGAAAAVLRTHNARRED